MLDLFCADQEILYNYKANITGNRGTVPPTRSSKLAIYKSCNNNNNKLTFYITI